MDASQAVDAGLSTWEWLGIIGFILVMMGGMAMIIFNMVWTKLDKIDRRTIKILTQLGIEDVP